MGCSFFLDLVANFHSNSFDALSLVSDSNRTSHIVTGCHARGWYLLEMAHLLHFWNNQHEVYDCMWLPAPGADFSTTRPACSIHTSFQALLACGADSSTLLFGASPAMRAPTSKCSCSWKPLSRWHGRHGQLVCLLCLLVLIRKSHAWQLVKCD